MNDHTISLVKESFDLVEPIAPQAAALFYANLFEADPTLKPLFRGDMIVQGQKLMQMIALAVSKLDSPATLMPALQGLGRRHAGYGVQDQHYDTVGAVRADYFWGWGADAEAQAGRMKQPLRLWVLWPRP